MLIIGDGPGAVAVRKEQSSGRIACAGMTVAHRFSGRPRGRAGEVYRVIVGSLVLISGNSEKSRSRVSRASTPCAAHIAAIRASWIMPPTTRGRCANRLRVSRKSSVSPISLTDGEAVHAASCRHPCCGVVAWSLLFCDWSRRSGTRSSMATVSPRWTLPRPAFGGLPPPLRGSAIRADARRPGCFVSTAITGLPFHRRSARAGPATNRFPAGLDHPDFLHPGRAGGIAHVWLRSTALVSDRLPPRLAADAPSVWPAALPGSAVRRGCPVWSSQLAHTTHIVKDGQAIYSGELMTTPRRWAGASRPSMDSSP